MRADELRDKSQQELEEELLNLRREHFSLKMQRSTGELNRHSEFGRVKRDIARIKTVMAEQKAAQQPAED